MSSTTLIAPASQCERMWRDNNTAAVLPQSISRHLDPTFSRKTKQDRFNKPFRNEKIYTSIHNNIYGHETKTNKLTGRQVLKDLGVLVFFCGGTTGTTGPIVCIYQCGNAIVKVTSNQQWGLSLPGGMTIYRNGPQRTTTDRNTPQWVRVRVVVCCGAL